MLRADATDALRPLIGEPLVDVGRSGDIVWVCFGMYIPVTDYEGNARLIPEYALHLACPARVTMADEMLLGSHDIYYPGDDPTRELLDFSRDAEGGNWFDVRARRLRQFLDSRMPPVSSLEVDAFGGIRVEFSHGLLLETFPVTSFAREQWRFVTRGYDHPRFVWSDAPPQQ